MGGIVAAAWTQQAAALNSLTIAFNLSRRFRRDAARAGIAFPATGAWQCSKHAAMVFCLDEQHCPPGLMDIFRKSQTALTLADPALPDSPLIAVNSVFCRTTGYNHEEVLGRNCRFLQPPGGAGPVRERIRSFLDDPALSEGRFVLANQTRAGAPFINVVYLAKLLHASGSRLILGSQFAVKTGDEHIEFYEQALRKDLVSLSELASEGQWMLMGSMDAIANTARIIAQHRWQ